jgi:hypothetical protein
MNPVEVTKPSVIPTLEHILTTLAFHVRCLATEKPTRKDAPYCNRAIFGLGLGGHGEGCPFVMVENIEITPSMNDDDPWGVWAQVHLPATSDRKGYKGNRAGAGDAYAKMCAPVIAWIAAYWARKGLVA